MEQQLRFAPEHSLISILDHSHGVVPDWCSGGRVWSTSSCIVVGTLPTADGETNVSLSDEPPVDMGGLLLAFDGDLETPGRSITVCSASNAALMQADVPLPITRIRVWTNDPVEPSDIRIVIGP